MRRCLFHFFTVLLALACSLPALAEQTATVLRDTELRSEPYSDAPATATLRAQSTVTILKRRGGWYQASQNRQQGWVRMSAIRMGTAQGGGSSGISETLEFLGTGRSDARGVTVATGIRGLDAADVANATPDHEAVKQLAALRVSAAQAKAFAAQAKLKSSTLAYMRPPEEKKPQAQESGIPGLGDDW